MSTLSASPSVSHEDTAEKLLTNQLLWMLFLRVVLYTLLLGVSAYLQGGKFDVVVLSPTPLFFFILFIYITSIGSGFILLNTDINPRRLGRQQNLLDTFFVTILVCLTGGSHSIFSPVFFFPTLLVDLSCHALAVSLQPGLPPCYMALFSQQNITSFFMFS